jgi:type IX secretion system PorP/SprF family membrane protein
MAQDIHFSQFTNAPSNLNPALTGDFEGDYRFIGIHRNQCNAVTRPYSTFGVSADANSFRDIAPLGIGASFYHDIAGDSRYRTLQAAVSGSWEFHLSSDSSHRLIAGIRPRFEQKRISYERLQFDKQYNGVRYDPSRSSGEDFARDQRAYMETDLGIRYRKVAGKRKRYGGGVALYNLFATEQSFYDNPAVQRDRRMTFFAQAEHPLSEEVVLQPSTYLGLQGSYHELIMGSEAEYVLHESLLRYRSVFAGLFYRTRDAGYVMAGMHYDEWRVALSYDINVSDLQPASRGRGGFEISVRYIMRTFERPDELHKTCPTFI